MELRQVLKELEGLGYILAFAIVLFVFGWLGIASKAWAWRNPKANQMTFWREMPAPMLFRKLEKYQ